jgi:hypothetical protein
MHRQTLYQLPRAAAIVRRGFCSTPGLRALPSVKQPHTLDKPGKDEHNPQTENMKKSRDEKAKTSQTPKEKKPEGRNAGIGFQVCPDWGYLTFRMNVVLRKTRGIKSCSRQRVWETGMMNFHMSSYSISPLCRNSKLTITQTYPRHQTSAFHSSFLHYLCSQFLSNEWRNCPPNHPTS